MRIYILTVDTCQYAFFRREEAEAVAQSMQATDYEIDEVTIYGHAQSGRDNTGQLIIYTGVFDESLANNDWKD